MSHLINLILRCILFVVLVTVAHPQQVFNTMPPPYESKFSCYGKKMGFYADVDANCKVYHTCDDYGNKFTYRCPQDTAFRQDALICDHAHLVDCEKTVIPVDDKTKEIARLLPSSSLEPPRQDDGGSYSRSFHIVRQPQSTSTNTQPGFVLSASLFLRDKTTTIRPVSLPNKHVSSTPVKVSASSSNNCKTPVEESKLSRSLQISTTLRPYYENGRKLFDVTTSRSSPSIDYYPYSETLRSIQANNYNNRVTTSTTTTQRSPPITELPVHALTLSLKPLVPNELEYDPYYPKLPTSTEAYFTPDQQQSRKQPSFRSTTLPPSWQNVHFEIPAVLPDLNSLEDLVDRRKVFYIPRLKAT